MLGIFINQRGLAFLLALVLLFNSCASSTMIVSTPPGAEVLLNGQSVGNAPYVMRDTKIIGTCTSVELKKPGYETLKTNICRNEEADAGPIILGFVVFLPFLLWCMKYNPKHSYNLVPEEIDVINPESVIPVPQNAQSVAEKLRDMKALLDEGVISQEEFDAQKAKLLAE